MTSIFNMFKRKSKPKHENVVETTYTEVKRKAYKGEWVKITNPKLGFSRHYKGDIVQIIDDKEHFYNHKSVGTGFMSNPDYACALYTSEYVVLEGYNGDEKTEDTP